MKSAKILFLTHHPFWLRDTGARNRAASVWQAIQNDSRFDVTVAYQRFLNAADRNSIKKFFPHLKVVDLPRIKDGVREKDVPALVKSSNLFKQHFNIEVWSSFRYLLAKEKPHLVFTSYIADLPYFSKDKVKKVLDTNDIVSLRSMAFSKMRQPVPFNIKFEDEMSYLDGFDLSLAIQDGEYSVLCSAVGPERAAYLPFTFDAIDPLPLNEEPGLRVIFPASHQPPNVDGLLWFLDNVWPYFSGPEDRLVVTGTIDTALGGEKCKSLQMSFPNVEFKGSVPDLREEYAAANIVINPVFYGSGMKVKSVEALKHGRCLVTTPIGAEGLGAGRNSAYLCATDAMEMVKILQELKNNRQMLHAVSLEGLKFYQSINPDDIYTRHILDRMFNIAAGK